MPMDDAERTRWADAWRVRAEHLELAAAGYRACGDVDYACELEAAARDNRRAALELELEVPA